MRLHLILRPTRTRRYSKTLLDFVNDFYVHRTGLEAVCLTEDDSIAVGERLIQELRRKAPKREIPAVVDLEYAAYWENFDTHLNDAIVYATCGLTASGGLMVREVPETVFVLLRYSEYRAWGGQVHTQYFPVCAATSHRYARQLQKANTTIKEMPVTSLAKVG